ncbi:MAG: TonB-dependent receptor [Verrucomicrobia bacterium]|nr:TonB-dependent receptor [Verrucomicrobiota bacterium]
MAMRLVPALFLSVLSAVVLPFAWADEPVAPPTTDVPVPTKQAVEAEQKPRPPKPAPAKDVELMNEYVVTGKKADAFSDRNMDISRSVDDVQPYYIFKADQIEQSGAVSTEDFLKNNVTMDTTVQSLSQTYNSQGQGASSSFNLRGLGADQTLVLVNGRRMPSLGNGQTGVDYQPDLNGIPMAAIDRVEVLPSSASAIYGGSAVGGVINLILKKDYSGGQIRYTYDNTFNTDAPRRSTDLTLGAALEGGRTHVMVTANYSTMKPLLLQDRRQIVEQNINTILKNNPSYFYTAATPFQGATTNIGLFTANMVNPATGVTFVNASNTTLILKDGRSLNSKFTYVPDGTLPSTPAGTLANGLLANAGLYNLKLASGVSAYGLKNYLGTLPERKAITASIRRDMMKNLEVFVDFRNTSSYTWAPYNVLGGSYTMAGNSPSNPFNNNLVMNIPASDVAVSIETLNDTHAATVGAILKLPHDWKTELDYTWSENNFMYSAFTYDTVEFPKALNNGTINPFVDTGISPLDLFKYVVPTIYGGKTSLNDLALRGSGPLFALPWNLGTPILTFGLEHRREGREDPGMRRYITYPLDATRNIAYRYLGQENFADSVYAELSIPLVSPKNNVPFVRLFDIQVALRKEFFTVYTQPAYFVSSPNPASNLGYSSPLGITKSKYSSFNPTMGFRYKPIDDFAIRASYAEAFKPPAYTQLVPNNLPAVALTSINDPVTNSVYGVSTISGGNPAIIPQTSRNFDAGAIYEVEKGVMAGFRADLEFYSLTQNNVITAPTAQFLLNNESVYKDRVTRDPVSGRVTLINMSTINLLKYKTDGFDVTVSYRRPTPIGILRLTAQGTIVEHLKKQVSTTIPMLEYVGYVSSGGPAKTKGNINLNWEKGRMTAGWSTHFFGSYKQQGTPSDPVYQGNAAAVLNTRYTLAQGSNVIPVQVMHDFFIGYNFDYSLAGSRGQQLTRRLLSGVNIQGGIKNVFNTLPQFDSFYSVYYYSPYSNVQLRTYWVSVKKSF